MAAPNMDQFEAYFMRADLDGDGRISDAEAVNFFQGSNLPKHVLAQVWMHAYQAKTGFLGRNEFYNALRLVTVAQSKRDLTPEIVKAALYGPAAARIPLPQINFAAIPPQQPNPNATAVSVLQMGVTAPSACLRPPVQGTPSHLDGAVLSDPKKSETLVLQDSFLNDTDNSEQNILNSKPREAATAEKKVLYKSRCDNRLNEITERASEDKRWLNDDEEVATGEEDKLVLQFMDSLNNYLSLSHSLSSTLRQGWMELASARHSMGTSRLNTSLLDLKFHPAATTLKITESDGAHPSFMLRKWVSSEDGSTQLEDKNEQPQDSSNITSHGLADNEEVQKERSKSLSVFGVLISPKLRATQLSFETALETLIEIANMRSSLLHSFHQLHQEAEDTKE